MLKFQRNYRAVFEIGTRKGRDLIPQRTITVQYPFTCQFHITAGINKGENRAVFQFINISETDRADLWIDTWNIGNRYVYMKFYAGYGENLPLVFEGFVQRCTSFKEGGSTENYTVVEAFDEGHLFRFGYINATFTEKTTLSDILKVVCSDNEKIGVGYITPDILPLKRNRTFIGNVADLVSREYSGYNFYINKSEINIIGENDVVPGQVQVISDESGLLGSPERGSAFVKCQTLFEPQLTAGQALVLQSYSLPWLNQAYKLVRVEHMGIISPVVCGRLISELTLTAFERPPRVLEKTTYESYSGQPTTGQWQKPVKGVITDSFGWRIHPIKKKKIFHYGIDIACNTDTPIYAPANGKVLVPYVNDGFGKYLEINHGKDAQGNILSSAYGHLNKWFVSANETVYKGQKIAAVGSTGYSTGPHLHFEVRKNGKAVNPLSYIGNY